MKTKSIFGPLVLIAAGLVWLLISMNVISASNVWALLYLLPYLLITLGLGLVLRSRWESASFVVSIVVVVGALAAVIFAPQLGWTTLPSWGINPGFGGSIPGSGKIETVTRDAGGFSAIRLEYPAEIIIQQGEAESVQITADDNLLPQLSTNVNGDTLNIRNAETNWNKRVDPSKAVKITIVVKDLRRVEFAAAGKLLLEKIKVDDLTIELDGAGEIIITELDAKTLTANLDGVGSITASGKADEVTVQLDGLGSFYGKDLQSLQANAKVNGLGSANLRAQDHLTAEINGAGSVGYYGDPKVTKNVNGAGSVTKLGQ